MNYNLDKDVETKDERKGMKKRYLILQSQLCVLIHATRVIKHVKSAFYTLVLYSYPNQLCGSR